MEHEQIRADRACAGCGFNLYGQSVTREEHYGLAIARCPECGTVAALQQYPAMTHWVNRFRLILGAIYVLILLAMFFGSTMGVGGFMFAGSSVASENLADHITLDFRAWKDAQNNPTTTQAPGAPGTAPQFQGVVTSWSTNLPPEYMDDDLDLALDSYGSFWANADPEWIVVMVPAFVICLGIGMFWSIALLGSSRKRAMVVPIVSCLVAAVFVIAANRPDNNNPWLYSYAHQLYIPKLVPVIAIIELTAMALGVFVGRMFARFVVRLALPPRMRVPLGILWSRDGLAMPSTKR